MIKNNKTVSEKNLKQIRLTAKDYGSHKGLGEGKKKGKYGITVPKPFNFDIRQKKKTIRE
jgi:hypothetical protein